MVLGHLQLCPVAKNIEPLEVRDAAASNVLNGDSWCCINKLSNWWNFQKEDCRNGVWLSSVYWLTCNT